jgi:Flp pilus assembly protein TadG
MIGRLIRKWRASRAGSSAVEFALLAPILLVMMGGAWEIGRIIQCMSTANKIASQYAIVWADCTDQPSGACQTEMAMYDSSYTTQNIAPQLANKATLQMFQVAMVGTTPTVTYAYPSGQALSAAQTTAAQNMLTSGQNGVIVTVTYTYSLSLFSGILSGIVPSSIPINYTVVQLKA